jgi:glutamine amidotransferase
LIAIIDYEAGNLRSVQKGFEKAGYNTEITNDPTKIEDASGVVLPGVGAFGDAMSNLRKLNLTEVVLDTINKGKPFLGICLGLQLLFEGSEEGEGIAGLGVLRGKVKLIRTELKVPHMGWNQLSIKRWAPLFEGLTDESFFYFVHSYHIAPEEEEVIAATTDYGYEFPVAVWRDNLFAVQFHPEKSQKAGLKILENFGRLVNGC